MLKTKLLHPDILAALGRAGHSSRVLIADGNFPFSSRLGPNADLVNLNLMPGVVSGTQALEAVLSAMPVEDAQVMRYATDGPYGLKEDPAIWAEYEKLLRAEKYEGPLRRVERFAFYDQAEAGDVVLTIATAEQRIYANLLLTIGVVMP